MRIAAASSLLVAAWLSWVRTAVHAHMSVLNRRDALQTGLPPRVATGAGLLDQYSHIFLPHIAKTGGGALNYALLEYANDTGHMYQMCYDGNECPHLNSEARLVSGHGIFYNYHLVATSPSVACGFGSASVRACRSYPLLPQNLDDSWNKSSVLYLTTLRRPLERIASYPISSKRKRSRLRSKQCTHGRNACTNAPHPHTADLLTTPPPPQ